jgi:tetratricopeptide (TPR) repeat protein
LEEIMETTPETPPELADKLKAATAAAQAQRLDEAIQLLDEVLAEDPDNLRAHDIYGFVLFFSGRHAEGEAHCRRAIELKPDHAYAHKGLGLHLARQGRLDEGVVMLERAIELRPEWFDPYWDLAVSYHEAGRPQEAIAVLERGRAAVPREQERIDGFLAQLRAGTTSSAPHD